MEFWPGTAQQTPLYKGVKARITERLMAGEWKTGEAIPSEARLAETFKVSIGTIRKAIDELVADNMLVRHQGRGTFVPTHNRDRTLFYFFRILGEDGRHVFPQSEFASFTKARADERAAAALALRKGAPVFSICHVLKLDGKPIAFDQIVISQALFPGMTQEVFRNRESTIYALYQSRFGINVVQAHERLRADLCDAETAGYLGIEAGAPVLKDRRIAYTYNRSPVEYRLSTINTAHHEYFNDLG